MSERLYVEGMYEMWYVLADILLPLSVGVVNETFHGPLTPQLDGGHAGMNCVLGIPDCFWIRVHLAADGSTLKFSAAR